MEKETFDLFVAHLFFLMYISIFCIWWYRAVQRGEFDGGWF